jgi:peptide/nickel transport system substrate-binding protein
MLSFFRKSRHRREFSPRNLAVPAKAGTYASAGAKVAGWVPAFAGTALVLFVALPVIADEAPKHGGILTYMIPADAPPSFDAQREETYATIHAAAPFYSVLIRANPMDPRSPDMVCDLCTEMPTPTDGGKTYTFKIRQGVKFHDGTPLTAADVAASWNKIIFPPPGVVSPRQSNFLMVDKVEATDPQTVVFRLKFATDAFVPALADPYAWIYSKAKLDQDIHWYEKNILGSGPFKFVNYETGQSIEGARNPDYYHPGLPYLDGFKGIFADKQVTRVEAIRSDRAAIEFRGFPPTVRDELQKALGDKLAVQESDWNCGGLITPNHKVKPFDDPRVRRALTLALDRWHTAPELAKIALVRTVGGVTFPGSPLAPSKDELAGIAGYWPDIEKSRTEARRLLKEAGAENLSFELLNRSTDQPYKYYGIWAVDDWSKIGLHVTQKVLPVGPWFEAQRSGNFAVTVEGNCQNVVNPLADVGKYLPHTISASNYGNFEDEHEVQLYQQLLRELDKTKQKQLLLQFAKYVLDDQAHGIFLLWWRRIVPYQSYVKGWNIGPSHYVNQDLGTVWLDK